jgi:hypothetical protein
MKTILIDFKSKKIVNFKLSIPSDDEINSRLVEVFPQFVYDLNALASFHESLRRGYAILVYSDGDCHHIKSFSVS